MDKKVEILHKQIVFNRLIFKVEAAALRYSQFKGGMSEAKTFLSLERGDGVAVLMHDTAVDTIVMVEQFRYSSYCGGDGWLLEIPAGILPENEAPAAAAIREVEEETGYVVSAVEPIGTFFLVPNDSSERIFLFYVTVKLEDQVGAGGGLIEEQEDLQVTSYTRQALMEKLAGGAIRDAKTIIALQWLQIHHAQ